MYSFSPTINSKDHDPWHSIYLFPSAMHKSYPTTTHTSFHQRFGIWYVLLSDSILHLTLFFSHMTLLSLTLPTYVHTYKHINMESLKSQKEKQPVPAWVTSHH